MTPSSLPAGDTHSPVEFGPHLPGMSTRDPPIDPGLEAPAPGDRHPPRPLLRAGARYWDLSPSEIALAAAMDRSSSPIAEPILGKRGRQNDNPEGGDDTEPEDGPISTTGPREELTTFGNIKAAVQHYAVKKKLRPEQRDDLDSFLSDALLGRQGKLFVLLTSIENKIVAQESAAPPYTLSEDLKTNISNYSLAVTLSVNISAYKGTVPTNHVLDILKRHRFDLPPGIEHDLANWEKVTSYVSYALTQARSKVKKSVKASIEANHNIFALAQAIVGGTPCRPTIQLCARVALMRAVHRENATETYWNDVDARLQFIRQQAKGSGARTHKAFAGILKMDRETYGAQDKYEIKDILADEWQQRVDDIVGGAANPVVLTGSTVATPVAEPA